MEEQLISFKTAKLAKEKSFNEKVYREYDKYGYLRCTSKSVDVVLGPYDELLKSTEYPAPTQSLLQKWLREVYNIHIKLEYFTDNTWDGVLIYQGAPYEWDDNTAPVEAENCKTYEEALEICLQEALKLI